MTEFFCGRTGLEGLNHDDALKIRATYSVNEFVPDLDRVVDSDGDAEDNPETQTGLVAAPFLRFRPGARMGSVVAYNSSHPGSGHIYLPRHLNGAAESLLECAIMASEVSQEFCRKIGTGVPLEFRNSKPKSRPAPQVAVLLPPPKVGAVTLEPSFSLPAVVKPKPVIKKRKAPLDSLSVLAIDSADQTPTRSLLPTPQRPRSKKAADKPKRTTWYHEQIVQLARLVLSKGVKSRGDFEKMRIQVDDHNFSSCYEKWKNFDSVMPGLKASIETDRKAYANTTMDARVRALEIIQQYEDEFMISE